MLFRTWQEQGSSAGPLLYHPSDVGHPRVYYPTWVKWKNSKSAHFWVRGHLRSCFTHAAFTALSLRPGDKERVWSADYSIWTSLWAMKQWISCVECLQLSRRHISLLKYNIEHGSIKITAECLFLLNAHLVSRNVNCVSPEVWIHAQRAETGVM